MCPYNRTKGLGFHGRELPHTPSTYPIDSTRTVKFKLGTLKLGGTFVALILTFCLFFSHDATAQIQQAWVARYNNDISNGTNQAVKMTIDAYGNIYVTGFSQNGNSNLGYATIKYAPNGNQLWTARYDSTNYPSAMPVGLVLDSSNNVIVTGNAVTVKYDSNGTQLWTAPYAGSAIAADPDGNVCVAGFGTSFNTVKLGPTGTNLWQQSSSSSCGAATSQAVVSDAGGNFYVFGSYPSFCERGLVDYELLIVKYAPNGNQAWSSTYQATGGFPQVGGAALDSSNSLYLAVNFKGYGLPLILKYLSTGNLAWVLNPTVVGPVGYGGNTDGLIIDTTGDVLSTGQVGNYLPGGAYVDGYGTYKANANGSLLWSSHFPMVQAPASASLAIAVDLANNSYVTGYSPGTNSENDIVTIKYDQNGNLIWLQRYNDQGTGYAVGNAIAVDNSGNVYVAGYEVTAAGGTEMVTIKYSPLSLRPGPDGSVLAQAQGSVGEIFDFLGSTDLLNWVSLGNIAADSNGVARFTDTNATQYNWRFYITSPQ